MAKSRSGQRLESDCLSPVPSTLAGIGCGGLLLPLPSTAASAHTRPKTNRPARAGPLPSQASRNGWPRFAHRNLLTRRTWWCLVVLLAAASNWFIALGCGWLQHPAAACFSLAGARSPQLQHLRPGSDYRRCTVLFGRGVRASGSSPVRTCQACSPLKGTSPCWDLLLPAPLDRP